MDPRRITWLDPCPDSVWELLPGGPEAWNDTFAEAWQYMGSIAEDPDRVRHEFRHRAHPLFDDARVYAHVHDGDAGPRLARLVANGRELALPGEDADQVAHPHPPGAT
jgi:hypothetical protein